MTYSLNTISKSWPRVNQGLLVAVALSVLTGLSGCSSAKRVLEVMTVPLQMVTPDKTPPLPNPREMSLPKINGWIIVTDEKPPIPGSVLWALTAKDYETLSRNMADIDRWVTEARWRMDYYREETKDRPADLPEER